MTSRIKTNYCCGIIICHGRCEKLFAEFIKRNLHNQIEIYSERNGTKSIQIMGLDNIFNNSIFKSKKSLLSKYETLKDDLSDFIIFPFMDFDDIELTDSDKRNYKNKTMFKKYWFNEYIQPIWSNPNLDKILYDSNLISVIPNNKSKVLIYNQFFSRLNDSNDITQIEHIKNKLSKNNNTNLDILIDYMLKHKKTD